MKNVLVTGGAGYIGSHACKALAASGYRPIAYDNLVNGHRRAVQWGPFEHGDILDRTRLDTVIAAYRPAAVIHFAAFAYVGESVEDPGKYYRNNVAGSLALLEAMRDHDITRMVFSSSCAIYGEPARVPISESSPLVPVNPYGMSKLIAERMISDFAAANGMRWMALRYFNAAGADPAGEIGEVHDPETRIIPRAIAAALGETGPFAVFGTDYDTPDGTCIRDYTHVSDLARAHVAALDAMDDNVPSQPINLGTGHGVSVRQVIDSVEECTGKSVPVTFAPRREGDPAVLIADPARAKAILGWKPQYPGIGESVKTALAWHLKMKG